MACRKSEGLEVLPFATGFCKKGIWCRRERFSTVGKMPQIIMILIHLHEWYKMNCATFFYIVPFLQFPFFLKKISPSPKTSTKLITSPSSCIKPTIRTTYLSYPLIAVTPTYTPRPHRQPSHESTKTLHFPTPKCLDATTVSSACIPTSSPSLSG